MKRRKTAIKIRNVKKRGREIPYLYKNRVYFGKKNTKNEWCNFKSYCTSFRKRRRRYQTLMVRKKYVWYINLKKKLIKEKEKEKKNGKGIGDGFKLLYSLRKQWRNSMQ